MTSHVCTWAAGETAVRVAGVNLVATGWVDSEVVGCIENTHTSHETLIHLMTFTVLCR